MGARLGQHFLKNPTVIERIISALQLAEGDFVIEIGPGRGALTREIIARLQNFKIAKFVAIEKDERLARALASSFQSISKHQFSNAQHIIIEGDALKVLPEISKDYKLKAISYKLVGNIPYYITGKLLRTIGELEHKPTLTVLMTQKEVAERVCAKPPFMNPARSRSLQTIETMVTLKQSAFNGMNLLAACVQYWADAEYLFSVSKQEFQPPPKVASAVIRLKIKDQGLKINDKYYKLVNVLFKQPRKTILNNLLLSRKSEARNLKSEMDKERIIKKLQKAGINPSLRPQNLSVPLIIKLSEML
ncbi:hypothetical protein A3A21_03900 [Candidatus Jorgensenbacteria bacterium RIFCSPLOWO2_01_FULL_45_25b]|uniref:Ribosomal RNA adenine methylase transferase N-terminal domain-containing protein n=1 Tax=Candidatus Jorgensenbacteria bacterium RIFCSPLOWO2_01_FULL_45_25b TaxID=1798471 RepID=A0A1F6BWH2_9BACT|nr:MAG: hypothetical protein A3A21_03900 [Candidatus Jorgensenbacteria bacterium RIFCSPLOWO2_01_FULL_45_25b]